MRQIHQNYKASSENFLRFKWVFQRSAKFDGKKTGVICAYIQNFLQTASDLPELHLCLLELHLSLADLLLWQDTPELWILKCSVTFHCNIRGNCLWKPQILRTPLSLSYLVYVHLEWKLWLRTVEYVAHNNAEMDRTHLCSCTHANVRTTVCWRNPVVSNLLALAPTTVVKWEYIRTIQVAMFTQRCY